MVFRRDLGTPTVHYIPDVGMRSTFPNHFRINTLYFNPHTPFVPPQHVCDLVSHANTPLLGAASAQLKVGFLLSPMWISRTCGVIQEYDGTAGIIRLALEKRRISGHSVNVFECIVDPAKNNSSWSGSERNLRLEITSDIPAIMRISEWYLRARTR